MRGYYTGVGSRTTPIQTCEVIMELATYLANEGWVLRSGGAQGADAAFEIGCSRVSGQKEIFLPWKTFNGNGSLLHSPTNEAIEIAKKHHPSFKYLSRASQLLMSRNTHQVLGLDLKSPSTFFVCWTPDGCETSSTRKKTTGGTGQAISVATTHSIPIFNLKNKNCMSRLFTFLDMQI